MMLEQVSGNRSGVSVGGALDPQETENGQPLAAAPRSCNVRRRMTIAATSSTMGQQRFRVAPNGA